MRNHHESPWLIVRDIEPALRLAGMLAKLSIKLIN